MPTRSPDATAVADDDRDSLELKVMGVPANSFPLTPYHRDEAT
jgi:hypothetical protein